MALQLKYSDEHGILHIDMTPSTGNSPEKITNPKFDSINQRFGKYDLFGGKYEEGSNHSLFRSRYNSFEEELANTPYAFATDRSEVLDITIEKDIEDNRFFDHDLFGPKIDLKKSDSFTVTQLIHAQDRYYDLSKKGKVRSIAEGFEVKSAPTSAKRTSGAGAFKVLTSDVKLGVKPNLPTVPTSKRKGETSFAIIAEPISRPNSPRSLPVEIRPGRVSPFKGRGFREETSRHNTPRTSAANSRSNSPPRRTHSLSRIEKMAQVATLPPPGPIHRPPRDFLKENIEEIRELSELNREKNEAEADKKKMEEEIALLKEMGLIDRIGDIKSGSHSRTNSRSNSPNRYNLRSRSNSPSTTLHLNNLSTRSSEFLNKDEAKPVAHRSRVRSVSKSQPQSCNGSPKHSKIPTRQNSVSPNRSSSRLSLDKSMSKNPRHISNSTSSIHESIRIGSTVHDKRTSQSSQHLSIVPSSIKNKPPISPGKSGPPPSNKSINPKRLSPIVGTPSKSPLEGSKPSVGKAPMKTSVTKVNTVKTTGAISAASKLNSRQPSRNNSRDSSPEKRKSTTGSISKTGNGISKSVSKTPSTLANQKPPILNKSDPKKPVSRTNSVKNLSRVPSTKTLNEKPPLNRQLSKKDVSEKSKSSTKINEIKATKTDNSKETIKKKDEHEIKDSKDKKVDDNRVDANVGDSIERHDNETQYDEKKTNEKEELVIMTKKNVVSMTTAAITSQPLEVVATVTNQLPAVLEKAREKAMSEIQISKDTILGKEGEKDSKTEEVKSEKDDKKTLKSKSERAEENIKLRALQPPYNNPQVERVKQKIDSILKEPEISTENILAAAKVKDASKVVSEKIKTSIKEEKKNETIDLKDKIKNQNEDITSEFKKEASKIVDSIITPIEQPKEFIDKAKIEAKKAIEPIVTVVSEKKKEMKADIEKITETLVKGGPEVEVLSSNVSTPGGDKIANITKMTDGASDKSHSNGGFPQSTSTTPKPPPRAHRELKDRQTDREQSQETQDNIKQNICSRLMGKCKTKCCSCCTKGSADEGEEDRDINQAEQIVKKPFLDKLNCFKKKVPDEDVEIAAGKGTTIEFESETKRKRKLRDVLCGYCRRQRVADVSEPPRHVDVTPPVASSDVVKETGCCGKKKEAERRDSILSDQRPSTCCTALRRWITGACRRSSETSSSRRTSLFSKNKSLSPTLPPESKTSRSYSSFRDFFAYGSMSSASLKQDVSTPSSKPKIILTNGRSSALTLVSEDDEDTRKKLDPSLIEHTSAMRGAVPVLALPLAVLCLLCNIIIPGLGTIFSGLFCLCFGIPRFGVHDGAKHRIGSLLINILVGCAQLFTVLFCLVGWGWAIWWGVIMVRVSRKYSKLKAEAAAAEAEAPPVTDNNHTRA